MRKSEFLRIVKSHGGLHAYFTVLFSTKRGHWKQTSVSMMSPMRKETTDTARMKSSLRFLRRKVEGYMSIMAVTRLSTHTNWSREKQEAWYMCRSVPVWMGMFILLIWKKEKEDSSVLCLCGIYVVLTWLSSPRKTIIMKKQQAHRGEKGIMDTARG